MMILEKLLVKVEEIFLQLEQYYLLLMQKKAAKKQDLMLLSKNEYLFYYLLTNEQFHLYWLSFYHNSQLFYSGCTRFFLLLLEYN